MTGAAPREAWLKARLALLEKEKALTRMRDEVAAERRALPKVRIAKDYVFTGPAGPVKLADLFEGKNQLIVYHFMLGPDWTDPCKSCSFWAEQFDALRVHLLHRDAALGAVSRAPFAKIAAVKARMGWRFPWYSSHGSDFNRDFHVSFDPGDRVDGKVEYNFERREFGGSEAPGLSVFSKNEAGEIFHTYSCYARGLDPLNGTYQLLDLTPKGRDEAGLPGPMAWVRLKDQYG